MADSKDSGLERGRRLEKTNQNEGRTGAETPIKTLRGDTNPTKGGGINRATESRGSMK